MNFVIGFFSKTGNVELKTAYSSLLTDIRSNREVLLVKSKGLPEIMFSDRGILCIVLHIRCSMQTTRVFLPAGDKVEDQSRVLLATKHGNKM